MDNYRFGFNGQEMDNEISGQTGTHTGLIRKNDLYYVDENTVKTIGFYRVFKNGISKITEKDIRIAVDGEINVSSEDYSDEKNIKSAATIRANMAKRVNINRKR